MSEQASGLQESEASTWKAKPATPVAALVARELFLDKATGRRSSHENFLNETAKVSVGLGAANMGQSDTLGALIHDARNMVAAMDIYCDLLAEPHVLSEPFQHYAEELRMVASASRRLLEKLSAVESMAGLRTAYLAPPPDGDLQGRSQRQAPSEIRFNAIMPFVPDSSADIESSSTQKSLTRLFNRHALPTGRAIQSLAEELKANQTLIAALAGPAITVRLSISGGHRAIAMTGDDLTRVLVNLARNATDVMPNGGQIDIVLEEGASQLHLSVGDNGPGIPESALDTVFSQGYTCQGMPGTIVKPNSGAIAWPVRHSGLGLSIVRSIVSAAGGSVWAANRTSPANAATAGAVFHLEFPIPKSPAGGGGAPAS